MCPIFGPFKPPLFGPLFVHFFSYYIYLIQALNICTISTIELVAAYDAAVHDTVELDVAVHGKEELLVAAHDTVELVVAAHNAVELVAARDAVECVVAVLKLPNVVILGHSGGQQEGVENGPAGGGIRIFLAGGEALFAPGGEKGTV